MEFQKVIEKRRTIRKFSNKEVSAEDIDLIIKNGALAPSSKNRQPWKFVVLKNSKKDEIASKMIDWVQKTNSNVDQSLVFNNSVYKTAIAIQQASALILIYKKNIMGNEYADLLSLGACLENMFLTAVNLKLGALWTTDILFAEKEINNILKVKDYELISGFAVGYPSANATTTALKEIITYKTLK